MKVGDLVVPKRHEGELEELMSLKKPCALCQVPTFPHKMNVKTGVCHFCERRLAAESRDRERNF